MASEAEFNTRDTRVLLVFGEMVSFRLGYAGAHNDNVIVAVQAETKACIDNMEEICKV